MSSIVVSSETEYHGAGFPRNLQRVFNEYFPTFKSLSHVFNYETWWVRLTPSKNEWRLTDFHPHFTKQPSKIDKKPIVDGLTFPDAKNESKNYTMIAAFVGGVDNELNDAAVSVSAGMKPKEEIISALKTTDPDGQSCSVFVPPFTRKTFENEGALCTHWYRDLDIYQENQDDVMRNIRKGMDLRNRLEFKFVEADTEESTQTSYVNTQIGKLKIVSPQAYWVSFDGQKYRVYESSCEDLHAAFRRLCDELTEQNISFVFSNQHHRPMHLKGDHGVRTMTPDEFSVLRLMRFEFHPDGELYRIIKNYWDNYAKQEMTEIDHPFSKRDKFVSACVFLVERAIQNYTTEYENMEWVRQMHDLKNVAVRADFKGPSNGIYVQINCIYVPNRLVVPSQLEDETEAEPVVGEWFASLPFFEKP